MKKILVLIMFLAVFNIFAEESDFEVISGIDNVNNEINKEINTSKKAEKGPFNVYLENENNEIDKLIIETITEKLEKNKKILLTDDIVDSTTFKIQTEILKSKKNGKIQYQLTISTEIEDQEFNRVFIEKKIKRLKSNSNLKKIEGFILYYTEDYLKYGLNSNARKEVTDLQKELDFKIGPLAGFGIASGISGGINFGAYRNYQKANENFIVGGNLILGFSSGGFLGGDFPTEDGYNPSSSSSVGVTMAIIPEIGYDFGTSKNFFWTFGGGIGVNNTPMPLGILKTGFSFRWVFIDIIGVIPDGVFVSIGGTF